MAWNIDTSHSEILFAVRHMMISTVRGQFNKFSGSINIDEANPANSSVEVTIDVASINTGMWRSKPAVSWSAKTSASPSNSKPSRASFADFLLRPRTPRAEFFMVRDMRFRWRSQ